MFSHILVATDGSDVSDRAADQAIELAQRLGARLFVLHVMPPSPAFAYIAEQILDEAFDKVASENAALYLKNVQTKAEARGLVCEVRAVTDNRPYCEIVSIAQTEGCDLIVMGSHGRQGLDRVLLGSETHKVLISTTLPVLVCH